MYSRMPAVSEQCPVPLPVLVETPPTCQRRNRRSLGRPARLGGWQGRGGTGGGSREHSPGSVVLEAPCPGQRGRRGRGRGWQYGGQHRDTVVLDLARVLPSCRADFTGGANEMIDTLDSALQLQNGFGRVVVVITTAVGAGVQGFIIAFIESGVTALCWFP